ncbi:MAG: hydrogenase [Candidatus Methanomethylophilaceae archaeon]|nr:hydrogenase [Candidatus Methanomethylophilaceae archaeon]
METVIGNLIDICAVSMLLASILSMTAVRMKPLIRLFSIQSLFLGAMAAIIAYSSGNSHIYIMCGLTVVIKGFLIPKILLHVLQRVESDDETSLSLGVPGSLLVSAGLVVLSYFITEPLISTLATLERNCLAFSLSVVLIGLSTMVVRRKAISEVIGLLMIENGLFLGALALSHGMPLIVEIGAFFDILMALIIIGVFILRINRSFHSMDVDNLRRLKE